MAAATGYARPEMLVETDWLAEHLNDPNLRIIDCDERPAYTRVHLPGAVTYRVHPYIKDKNNSLFVAPPDQVAEVFGSLGIDGNTEVVTYDGFNGLYAARIWWVLNYYGHTKVRVLNGGVTKWLAEQRPLDRHETRVSPQQFTPKANPDLIATADQIVQSIQQPEVCRLDVRSDDEWTGKNKRGTKRGGHIPGAVHLEWTNFNRPDATWKPADELRQLLTAAGVSPDREVITY